MAREVTEEEKSQWREVTKQAVPKKDSPQLDELDQPVISTPLPLPSQTKVKPRPATAKDPSPLILLDGRMAARAFRAQAQIHASIDLHGMTQDEAKAALERFLQRQIDAGARHITIITGKGRDGVGVLRRAVPQWLEMAPWRAHIASIAHAPPKKGGVGVLHVLLKKMHDHR